VVSKGLIRLARLAGCPIQPLAMAGTRRTILSKIWDEMQLNHPFAQAVVVAGEMLEVGDGMDDDAAAARLKAELDRIYARALDLTARPARQ
jgi:lysophospholipid acyltransferase (LPLAT)-like uncharacterized protein